MKKGIGKIFGISFGVSLGLIAFGGAGLYGMLRAKVFDGKPQQGNSEREQLQAEMNKFRSEMKSNRAEIAKQLKQEEKQFLDEWAANPNEIPEVAQKILDILDEKPSN